MQKFELTDRQLIDIQLLHSSSGLNSLPATEEVKAIAHEAQKELVKWQQEECIVHGTVSTRRQFCIKCRKDLLKHFGLYKEEK